MAAQTVKSNREITKALADIAAQQGQRIGQLIYNALQVELSGTSDTPTSVLFYAPDDKLLDLVIAYAQKTARQPVVP